MRIFLLPISTRRALIYCEKQPPSSKTSYADWAINKASTTWADLEKAPKGWKKSLVNLGNGIFRRIPFEEWGLKTLPSYSKSTVENAAVTKVLFPGRFLEEGKVPGLLARIATERQKLHKQRMGWSIVGMPLTIPVAILPVIPNIPLFYLAFRAWSHYKGWLKWDLVVEHVLTDGSSEWRSLSGAPAQQEDDHTNRFVNTRPDVRGWTDASRARSGQRSRAALGYRYT